MSKYSEIIKKINELINYLLEKPNFAEFKNGGYSYSKNVVDTIGSITEYDEFVNIYIPNLKEKFQKGDIDNLSLEECITYFHWLWTAERLSDGAIKTQIDRERFQNISIQLKNHLLSISSRDDQKNKMELRDYIVNQIKKSYYKKYENYCITRIYHLLNKSYVKIITQQMFKRDNGIALADLFFPQLNLIVEIDESYHEDDIQKEKDKKREQEIIANKIKSQEEIITNKLEIKRIKITDKSLDEINSQIDQLVLLINQKIENLNTKFIPWTHLYYEPQYFINIGYIDETMNTGFRTLQEVSELFNKGYHGNQHAYFWAKNGDNNLFVWCPQLKLHETDCDNIPYDNELDDNYIYESSKKDSETFVSKALETEETRCVFAKYKDEVNNWIYKFKGVYKLDKSKTVELKTKRAWLKISDKIELTDFFK